ncbi:MAG: hypothetical protein ACJAW7_002046 [Candidatus Azotimanducaceae bacterium]|jgi:hypothetical protein
MDNKQLQELAAELSKGLKTLEDLAIRHVQLTKKNVEVSLKAEMNNT